jgi:hypothetical protein
MIIALIIAFVCGAASSIVATLIFAGFITRPHQKRENTRQWEAIQQFLLDPALLVTVGGSGTLMGRPNPTKWAVVVRPHIEVPIGDDSATLWQLNRLEWAPNSGPGWSLSKELVSHIRNPTTKVYLEVSYEPVHKNIGNVAGVEIGDLVRLNHLDFKPQDSKAQE